jgi:hypothetical protein
VIQLKKRIVILIILLLCVGSVAQASGNVIDITGVKQANCNAAYKDGISNTAKLEAPYALTVHDKDVYIMDGYHLRLTHNQQVSTLANLDSFKSVLTNKGILNTDDFAGTIRIGNMTYKNGNIYIGALMTDVNVDSTNPFLQDDQRAAAFSGWQYITIWKYNIESKIMTLHYIHKSDYSFGLPTNAFFDTESGEPGSIFDFCGTAIYDYGRGYLGTLYVDDNENIYGIWSDRQIIMGRPNPYIYKVDKTGKETRLVDLYRPSQEFGYQQNPHFTIAVPNKDGSFRVYDGGSVVMDVKLDETYKIQINKNTSRSYVDMSHPLFSNGKLYFMNGDGISMINWQAKTADELVIKVWTPEDSDRSEIGSVKDWAYDNDNFYFINWYERKVKMIRINSN